MSAGKHATCCWVGISKRLPASYQDVPVLLKDGAQRVARLNRVGCWELASYQACRHQYMSSDVVAWYDAEIAQELLEALKLCRGQWIHSANAERCLAAIANAEGAAL